MAGFDYAKMQGTATRLMTRFQQGTVTLTHSEPGEPDPETPWQPGAPVETTYTLKATVRGVSKDLVDGTAILASDLEVTAAVFGAEPDPADTVTIDGKAVTLLRVIRVPAAGTVVAWKLLVRG